MALRPLSEMEACVLALIWSGGPSTPYAIRQVFRRSPSPQWSGSAGSIYPLVERLERGRLIRSATHATGRRQARLYSLTGSGTQALENWLETTAAEWVAGVPPDPLRTRIRFLGALPAGRRRALLDEAQKNVERHFAAVRRDCRRCRKEGDPEYWMARGAVLAMQARRAWLRELLAAE